MGRGRERKSCIISAVTQHSCYSQTVTILGHGWGFSRNQEVGGPLVEIPHDFQQNLEISLFYSPLPSAVLLSLTKCTLFCVIRTLIDQFKCEASKSNMRSSSNLYANKCCNPITGIYSKNIVQASAIPSRFIIHFLVNETGAEKNRKDSCS